ncbi:hypothetical protein D3C81_1160200 [compost metagenome]
MAAGTTAAVKVAAPNAIDNARTKTVFLNMWFPNYYIKCYGVPLIERPDKVKH